MVQQLAGILLNTWSFYWYQDVLARRGFSFFGLFDARNAQVAALACNEKLYRVDPNFGATSSS